MSYTPPTHNTSYYKMLLIIAEAEDTGHPLRLPDLAERLGKTPMNVAGQLSHLHRLGVLYRKPILVDGKRTKGKPVTLHINYNKLRELAEQMVKEPTTIHELLAICAARMR